MKSLIFQNTGGGFRVEFVTDLIGNNRAFTVSEIKGLSDIEQENITFLFKELPYTKADFIKFAQDNNLKLVEATQDSATTLVNVANEFEIETPSFGGSLELTENTPMTPEQFTTLYGIGQSTFEITDGELPTGLTLSESGLLSGTPTLAQTQEVTITATDSFGSTDSIAVEIVVA